MSFKVCLIFHLYKDEICRFIFGQKWRAKKQMFALNFYPYIGGNLTKINESVSGQKWREKGSKSKL